MLEELQRRHYSEATTQRYIRSVERFAQHFHCSPDRLGPRHTAIPGPTLQRAEAVTRLGDEPSVRSAVFLHPDAEKAVEHCRHSLSQETPPSTHHSQSGRSSATHRCRSDCLLSHPTHDPLCHRRTQRRVDCPKCQTGARERWIEARRSELLPSPYVHVVFTLPPQLAALALQNKKLIYGLLLRASAETLLEVARNPRHLGAEIGFFSVLHTWNQKLQHHPHVHCVVPAGGLALDHTRWIPSHPRFFLPIPLLREVFRGKFVDALKLAFQRGQLHFSGDLAQLALPKFFAAWLRPLFRKNWVVYSKPPFGGPQDVLQYLGRYTHRVAISNHRLVSLAGGQVTFRWRDSADHNQQKLMTLSLDEFLRRFLLHLLPKGFVRIPHFGFLANRRRSTLLPLCFAALGTVPSPLEPETSPTQQSHPLWRCPKCGGPMAVIEPLTAAQIQLRSPPRSQLRHETAPPQLANSARFTALRPPPPGS
jgi:Putative transposase/Transposase zinc-binding domain